MGEEVDQETLDFVMIEDPETSPTASDTDDEPSEEELSDKKGQNRINALILGLVFLVFTLAPEPLKNYAPLLFLFPFVYSIVNKIRKRSISEESGANESDPVGIRNSYSVEEPYASKAKDSKDPRRYKPIG